jgi:hypothetical protein
MLDTSMYLTVRASLTREWRARWFGTERDASRRNTIFGDVALTKSLPQNLLTGGVGFERDQFAALDQREFSYRYTTPALYGEGHVDARSAPGRHRRRPPRPAQ